jgi:hypothetical protein
MYRIKVISDPPSEFDQVAPPFSDASEAIQCAETILDAYANSRAPPVALSVIDLDNGKEEWRTDIAEWPTVKAIRDRLLGR